MNATAPHSFPPCTTPCGRDSSAKGPIPSRPSISIPCSTSPPAPASMACGSKASISSSPCPIPISIPPTTIWRASPTSSHPKDCAPDRWSRRSGRPPAAAPPWATTPSARVPHPGRKSLPHRPQAARSQDPPIRHHPHRFRRQPRRLGQGPRRPIRSASPRPSAKPRTIAESFGERLAAEGEICWAGMHSWRRNVATAGNGGPPARPSASRPTWRTPCSSPWATTRPKTACCPTISTGPDRPSSPRPTPRWPRALRPWTIDFHVAQNDGTVKGAGSHDKTGRHCPPHDPNGKLDIVRDAGAWLRDDDGAADPRRRSTSAGTAACSPTP